MDNSKYLINVYWQPKRATGQQLVFASGVTYSVPTYTEGYYVASMPEINLSTTASDRATAFNDLLSLVATASNFGNVAFDQTNMF